MTVPAHWSILLKKYLYCTQCNILEHPTYFPNCYQPNLFFHLKLILKENSNPMNVTVNPMTWWLSGKTPEGLKNGFQECFQNLHEYWQTVPKLLWMLAKVPKTVTKEKYSERNITQNISMYLVFKPFARTFWN